jgi:hypothetical protein
VLILLVSRVVHVAVNLPQRSRVLYADLALNLASCEEVLCKDDVAANHIIVLYHINYAYQQSLYIITYRLKCVTIV